MSPLARLLLALAVLHAAACAIPKKIGDAQAQCTTITHGDTNGPMHTVETTIDAGIQRASVDVQNPWCSLVKGQQVTVCDDLPPTLYVPDLPQYTPLYVTRNGRYTNQDAYLSVTLWCYGEYS